jgi:hypothetical protein
MSNIITLIQSVLDLTDGLQNSELKRKIAELNTEVANLLTENKSNKEQIQMLQNDKNNPLYRENQLYYDETDKTPYCPQCYEAEMKRIHLIGNSSIFLLSNKLTCPRCKSDFPPPFPWLS